MGADITCSEMALATSLLQVAFANIFLLLLEIFFMVENTIQCFHLFCALTYKFLSVILAIYKRN